jgi:hypothetical protein
LASPAKAYSVLRNAHLASFTRSGCQPQELFVPPPTSAQVWGHAVCGLVHAAIDPDVSTTTMKYGFAGGGHIFGSGELQSKGCACAIVG